MNQKQNQIVLLDRPTIINELRRYAHPSWFHSLLSHSTNTLRGLLVHYEAENIAGIR